MMAVTRMDGRNSRGCAGRGFRNGLLEQGGGCVAFGMVVCLQRFIGRKQASAGMKMGLVSSCCMMRCSAFILVAALS